MKMKPNLPKPLGNSEDIDRSKVYSYKHLVEKAKRSGINNIAVHIKVLGKQGQTKAKCKRWQEIICPGYPTPGSLPRRL